jgi:hypothetical protein
MLAGRPAQAQSGEGLYAAPGHLITFPHRKPPPAPRPDAVVSPILPRFWHDEVNGRTRASDFYKFMSQYLKYPKPAIDAGMVGRIFVRLTVDWPHHPPPPQWPPELRRLKPKRSASSMPPASRWPRSKPIP